MARSGVQALAERFLFSKNSDRFLSVVTWASVIGVALGVSSLVVVFSVVNGFEGELTKAITGNNGEVVFYSRGNPVQDPERIEKKLKEILSERVEAITPSFISEIMITSSYGVKGALLEGVDLDRVSRVLKIKDRIIEGKFPENPKEIALAVDLARSLGAQTGSEVRLVAPFAGEDRSPISSTYRVSGIFKLGMYQYDSKYAFMTLGAVQEFLKLPGAVTAWKLKLKNGSDPLMAAQTLNDSFGSGFRAKGWPELNRNLFYAIHLEKIVIGILLASIIGVASLNVVSTLMVMIHDRRREILILKAMGLKRSQGFSLFGRMGIVIGIAGVILGLFFASILYFLITKTGWFQIPSDIYMISYLPVRVRGMEILVVSGFALFLCGFATLYPSWRASRISPAEGMKEE